MLQTTDNPELHVKDFKIFRVKPAHSIKACCQGDVYVMGATLKRPNSSMLPWGDHA